MTSTTLIERLRQYAQADDLHKDERDTLIAAAAALEAAREDACVALVADIRFACGDNGKRMQPELVEFIRDLAEDAERYRWLRAQNVIAVTSHDQSVEYQRDDLDAEIDQARGKEVAG